MNIDFSKGGGLVPVVVQDWKTKEVLMLGYMNEEAWRMTRETGKVHYYSRSRDRLWLKGESSGHTQEVREILIDCDGDTLVVRVRQAGGAACHLGYRSCFFRRLENQTWTIVQERFFDPEEVYRK
jgi:phosphoribosyl-AMP cyclohydrolase